MSSKSIKMIIPVLVIVILWFIPGPSGLSVNAWHFLGIFFGVVVGLILEPIPSALIGFTGISLVALLGLISPSPKANISWALSGFSNTVIWLIFAAFMFALGYKKTGLGNRISLLMIKYMGKSSLGLGYAVAFSDLILAPFMPSNTARSAGTIFPVASNIPLIFNSKPDHEPRKLGSYITWVAMTTTCITSSMFLTALAPNLLAVDLINQGSKHLITWGEWAKIMIPLMVPLFIVSPWLIYVIYPPTQKKSPEAPAWAKKELEKIGGISKKEILMGVMAIVALVLWIFGKEFGIHSTTVAICVVAVLVLTNVISWDDVISNKTAFNTFIWFSSLVAMASGLKKVGILDWIGVNAQTYLATLSPTMLIVSMLVFFFLLHYFFASVTAHVTALVPIFIAIAIKLVPEAQIVPFEVLLAGSLGVMGIITPYGTGPSPVWYGSGYVKQATWWGLGLIFGVIYFAAIIIGSFIYI